MEQLISLIEILTPALYLVQIFTFFSTNHMFTLFLQRSSSKQAEVKEIKG